MASSRRTAFIAMIALGFAVALTACSSGATFGKPAGTAGAHSRSSGTPTPTPTPPPTATPKPKPTQVEGTVNGYWCPTRDSGNGQCVRVELPNATFADGTTANITAYDSPWDYGHGVLAYSMVDTLFGIFLPAGVPIDAPYDIGVKDLPDQDRIWNSQTGLLLVRATPSSPEDFPAQLRGTWKAKDGSDHFSVEELLSTAPQAFVDEVSASEYLPGATDYRICYVADMDGGNCTMAAAMRLRYIPAGIGWDCAKAGREGKLLGGFAKCDPDFTSAHDISKPRLLLLPSHQHNKDYVDSVPMYRTGD